MLQMGFKSWLFRRKSRHWNSGSVPLFNLTGPRWVKCLKVYDGDTFYLATEVHGHAYQFSCRGYGWDCPEKRPHGLSEIQKKMEIELANMAENTVIRWWEDRNNVCKVEFLHKRDKYGRFLVDIPELRDLLFERKLAVPYYGERKVDFELNDVFQNRVKDSEQKS